MSFNSKSMNNINTAVCVYVRGSRCEGGIYAEESRAEIAALSKKKGNNICSECGEPGERFPAKCN